MGYKESSGLTPWASRAAERVVVRTPPPRSGTPSPRHECLQFRLRRCKNPFALKISSHDRFTLETSQADCVLTPSPRSDSTGTRRRQRVTMRSGRHHRGPKRQRQFVEHRCLDCPDCPDLPPFFPPSSPMKTPQRAHARVRREGILARMGRGTAGDEEAGKLASLRATAAAAGFRIEALRNALRMG